MRTAKELGQGLLTTGDYAKRNNISERTVREWAKDGKIPGAFRTPGGEWRFPEDGLQLKDRLTRPAMRQALRALIADCEKALHEMGVVEAGKVIAKGKGSLSGAGVVVRK